MKRDLTIFLLLFLLQTIHLSTALVNKDSEEPMMKKVFGYIQGRDPWEPYREKDWGPVTNCRLLGQECKMMSYCCDSMACYYKGGFTIKQGGVCVPCIKEGQKCQRDSGCCSHLQCDSGNALWIDGTCQRYRRSGSCYRDGQCVTKCVKKWYQTHGECS